MNHEELISLYDSAYDLWGEDSQVNMVIEECSELIEAICKRRRGRVEITQVASEVADVQIVCGQLQRMLERETGTDLVTLAREHKLKRLSERVAKANNVDVN